MDELSQDQAVDYVMGALTAEEAREFEARLSGDPALRSLVAELQESAAALALAAPQIQPPPDLREKVLASIRGETLPESTPLRAQPARSWNPLAWAIAAGFVVTTAALWFERDAWKREALALRGEAAELRNRDEFAQIHIASLSAQVEMFSKAAAVVVWDAKTQRGVLRLVNLPPADAGKDYQLWVIDPKYPAPVNGGVIPVNARGETRMSFAPDQPVRNAGKFAISIERAGGVPKAEGPIVFVGE